MHWTHLEKQQGPWRESLLPKRWLWKKWNKFPWLMAWIMSKSGNWMANVLCQTSVGCATEALHCIIFESTMMSLACSLAKHEWTCPNFQCCLKHATFTAESALPISREKLHQMANSFGRLFWMGNWIISIIHLSFLNHQKAAKEWTMHNVKKSVNTSSSGIFAFGTKHCHSAKSLLTQVAWPKKKSIWRSLLENWASQVGSLTWKKKAKQSTASCLHQRQQQSWHEETRHRQWQKAKKQQKTFGMVQWESKAALKDKWGEVTQPHSKHPQLKVHN